MLSYGLQKSGKGFSLSSVIGNAPPALDLDFISKDTLDDSVTFTRASSGTYFDSSGILQTASTNVARFDYNPSTLAARGLLIEEARTNLITYSEDFTNAVWLKARASVTANTGTSPDGLNNLTKLKEDTTASNTHALSRSFSITGGQSYSCTIFAKQGERKHIMVGGYDGYTGVDVRYNLETGVIEYSGSATSAAIERLPNGLYKCTFTRTTNAAATNLSYVLYIHNGTSHIYNGDGSSGIYIWGAQFEAGAAPSSYIATTSATVTRAADVADITTLTPWYNAAAGTLFAQYERAYDSASGYGYLSFNDNSAAERIYLVSASSTTTQFIVTDGGVNQCAISVTRATTGIFKSAAAYTANSFQTATGGTLGTEDTSGTIPTVNRLSIGAARSGVGFANAWIRNIRYYPVRLPNTTLQSLTS